MSDLPLKTCTVCVALGSPYPHVGVLHGQGTFQDQSLSCRESRVTDFLHRSYFGVVRIVNCPF